MEILEHQLSERHARALLRIDDMTVRQKVLHMVVEKNLNVSQTEELVAAAVQPKTKTEKSKTNLCGKGYSVYLSIRLIMRSMP